MQHDLSLKEMQKEWHGTGRSYFIGFTFSLFSTLTAFLLVTTHWLAPRGLVYSVVVLALLQAACQLRFFLHLGQEARPRWETVVFYLMFILLLIVVLGSLWIMYDLNDRVMSDMGEMSRD